jgi:flagellin-like hook-associated protein FlgL
MTGSVYAFTAATPAPDGALLVDVGGAQLLQTAHDGASVFGDDSSGVLAALRDLASALDAGARPAVAAALPALDSAMQTVNVLTAENGAWANRVDLIGSANRMRNEQLTADTTAVRDVDLETAMTELMGRQTALQAAMAATARTFGMSLTDYLR